jgi:hypothetical protein
MCCSVYIRRRNDNHAPLCSVQDTLSKIKRTVQFFCVSRLVFSNITVYCCWNSSVCIVHTFSFLFFLFSIINFFSHAGSYPMGTGIISPGKAAGASSLPLTHIVPKLGMCMELYLHSSIRLHGLLLRKVPFTALLRSAVCSEAGLSNIVCKLFVLSRRNVSLASRMDFSSILRVQTGSGAHPTSCTMGTGVPFPGGKARPGREADHSSPI